MQLPADQYQSYDANGDTLATRSVRVFNLSDLSSEGPGICFVLRSGFEPETGDGIGVSLTITDEQLVGLGYTRIEPLTAALQAMADSIFDPLPFDGPEEIEEMLEEEPASMLSALGGIPLETYLKAVYRAFPKGGNHEDPYLHEVPQNCIFLGELRAKVVEIINEDLARSKEPKFAFCQSCDEMVAMPKGQADKGAPDMHSYPDPVLVYCTWRQEWIPYLTKTEEVPYHGPMAYCIDRTGASVHPDAK